MSRSDTRLPDTRPPEARLSDVRAPDTRPSDTGTVRAVRGARPLARPEWAVTGALLMLLVVANGALGTLLQGTGWWWMMALVAAAVLFGLAGLRRVGLAESLSPVAGFGILLLTMTLLFGGGTGLFWLIPSLESLDRFRILFETGIVSIERQGTPAEATPGILLLLCAGAGMIALLIHILAITLRVPALVGLPVFVPVSVPGLVVEGGADPLALVLTAVAFLVFLRVEVRVRRTQEAESAPVGLTAARVIGPVRRRGPGPLWGSVVVGSIGIVGALVLSVATPTLPGGGLIGSNTRVNLLFGTGVTPLINLGQDLRRPESSPALHYRTSATVPPYLKLLTLDNFVGATWVVSAQPNDTGVAVDAIDPPVGLSPEVVRRESKTQIVIDGVSTRWLPTPNAPKAVEGLVGDWYWDAANSAIASPTTITRGQQYSVTALELAPTAEQLRAAGTRYPVSIRSNLDLPRSRPDIIDLTAREVTGATDSPYDAAVALQDFLRGNNFAYDTEAPVEDGYDGGGIDVVGEFLEAKRGYCVHFASAMAVMARSIGIPARLAVGYLPGSRSTSYIEGRDRFNVDAHDLHSWPELFFEGVGWVAFEPTPGRGTVPAYTRPTDTTVPLDGELGAAPSAAPRDVDVGGQLGADGLGSTFGQTDVAGDLVRTGLLLSGILLLLALPGAVRLLRRAGRHRRIRSGRNGPAEAWDELVDTAVDHGTPVRDTETPRELAARLATVIMARGPDSADALHRLLVCAERARYGRPGGTDSRASDTRAQAVAGQDGVVLIRDLDAVARAIQLSASWRTRARAIALPMSLLRTRAPSRNERSLVGA